MNGRESLQETPLHCQDIPPQHASSPPTPTPEGPKVSKETRKAHLEMSEHDLAREHLQPQSS